MPKSDTPNERPPVNFCLEQAIHTCNDVAEILVALSAGEMSQVEFAEMASILEYAADQLGRLKDLED